MLRTNRDRLPVISLIAEVAPPTLDRNVYVPDREGRAFLGVGMGGIVYNVRVGDPACGWAAADHIEPAVSVSITGDDPRRALDFLACVGDEAVVVAGMAKGGRGVVTGKHARVIIDFPDAVLEQLAVGDRILIKTWGTGLALLDHPDVRLKCCSPRFLDAMGITEGPDGRLRVPVAATIPAEMMGSGMELPADYVDCDLMSGDWATYAAHGLDRLRLGDLVAIQDQDHSGWRGYRKGAVTIGIVIHGDSPRPGHGPGIGTVMTSPSGRIEPVMDDRANLATMLGLREWRTTAGREVRR
ncbi:MAG: DUF4438 domain-containing protein [Armatimonadetes bacterium]|nr:DUF4438 domain-containing protein [Armatimonadota bacterium]